MLQRLFAVRVDKSEYKGREAQLDRTEQEGPTEDRIELCSHLALLLRFREHSLSNLNHLDKRRLSIDAAHGWIAGDLQQNHLHRTRIDSVGLEGNCDDPPHLLVDRRVALRHFPHASDKPSPPHLKDGLQQRFFVLEVVIHQSICDAGLSPIAGIPPPWVPLSAKTGIARPENFLVRSPSAGLSANPFRRRTTAFL